MLLSRFPRGSFMWIVVEGVSSPTTPFGLTRKASSTHKAIKEGYFSTKKRFSTAYCLLYRPRNLTKHSISNIPFPYKYIILSKSIQISPKCLSKSSLIKKEVRNQNFSHLWSMQSILKGDILFQTLQEMGSMAAVIDPS